MGLFNRNEENKAPANPNNMFLIRMLAVGYLLYTLYTMIRMYVEGGEDAPSLGLLIAAIVLFVGGSVWVVMISLKQWKRMKAEQQAAYEEEERLEAEQAEAEEDEFDDGEEENND